VTLGYPNGQDYKDFYPLTVMETGYDILFPWVSRMIMLGLYVTKKVPFTTVYLHGLVTDTEGKKMSKSRGNVVNPMDMLAKYGADALRMGLIAGRSPGLNQAFDEAKVVGGRNFANKLWNIARYIEDAIGDKYQPGPPRPKTAADHWWLDRLNQGIKDTTKSMDDYRFAEAYEILQKLIWNDFADWYIEASKTALNPSVLAHSLNSLLTLTHPLAPFVTETIWQTLGWNDGLLMSRDWPEPVKIDARSAASFEPIRKLVTEIRDLFTRMKLRENTLYHKGDPFIEANQDIILKMTKLVGINKVDSGKGLKLTQAGVDAWLDVEFAVVANYAKDLEDQQAKVSQSIKQLQGRLDNPAYAKKAPKPLVRQTKAQLANVLERQEQIQAQLAVAKTSLRT
jgi:valyl-tRNA synthetase